MAEVVAAEVAALVAALVAADVAAAVLADAAALVATLVGAAVARPSVSVPSALVPRSVSLTPLVLQAASTRANTEKGMNRDFTLSSVPARRLRAAHPALPQGGAPRRPP